ncbi:carbohydrate ABC transporter permease [Lactovum odontotermitis]
MFKKKNSSTETIYGEVWSKGDIFTKLSFFILGISQLKNKQWLKGLIFLIAEIGFFVWLIFNGFHAISMLRTLGTNTKAKTVFDEAQGVYVQKAADNSMLFLLFGILALIVIVLFVVFYFITLKSTRHLYDLNKANKHVPTTREDLASLLNERLHATLMAIPLLGVLLFTILPILYMISIAFTNFDSEHQFPGNSFTWIGLQNFADVLTGRIAGTFFPILLWTIIWAIAATATTFFFGVLLAILIESKGIKFKSFWRIVFVTVFAVPQFVSLLMMHQFLDKNGALNTLLQNLGWVKTYLPFFSDPMWARVTVITVNMWIGIPVSMLVSTAIIQNLPQDQIEAARIDGASTLQIFRKITFPQILFVMSPALIQQFIGNINNFNVIYLLTGGGPNGFGNYYQAGSTDLLVTWLYRVTMMNQKQYNLGSVIGIMIFILSAVISLIAYRRTNAFKEG